MLFIAFLQTIMNAVSDNDVETLTNFGSLFPGAE